MEESIAMNGGDGPYSYTQNSKFQEAGSDVAKVLLSNSIKENLQIGKFCDDSNQEPFTIVDYGCSVGPNTFASIQTILDSVQLKFKTQRIKSKKPEFLVFFNDLIGNDFNTLFQALPADRKYFAAGVAGSFHEQLFPKASVNFMHSAFALHWLRKVPDEVMKVDSVTWNKGRITYVRSPDEVVKAYAAQFSRDVEAFLKSRSMEMAEDGLLVILMPCRPEGSAPADSILMQVFECLAYTLGDMAKEGIVSEALVDSFNLPIFIPTASDVKDLVSKMGCFSIEEVEETYYPPKLSSPADARLTSSHIRAAMEVILSKHFGSEVIDELFERYTAKLFEFSKTPAFTRIEKLENLFMFLKKNAVSE
ncbi:loganic acid O-methyltransferase-like isoform X3 [Tripterygium wilfordii]|nr:loganic acid O-methyltransferase-like isoform X3 [Tripterygium wilfordii]